MWSPSGRENFLTLIVLCPLQGGGNQALRQDPVQSPLSCTGSSPQGMAGDRRIKPIKPNLGHVRLGSIRNKNNWNIASKCLFGSYSHSGIPGFPFRLFYFQEQNSRNIFRNKFLFRIIPNERALKTCRDKLVSISTSVSITYLPVTGFFFLHGKFISPAREIKSRKQWS